jgi:hypothetical protein
LVNDGFGEIGDLVADLELANRGIAGIGLAGSKGFKAENGCPETSDLGAQFGGRRRIADLEWSCSEISASPADWKNIELRHCAAGDCLAGKLLASSATGNPSGGRQAGEKIAAIIAGGLLHLVDRLFDLHRLRIP